MNEDFRLIFNYLTRKINEKSNIYMKAILDGSLKPETYHLNTGFYRGLQSALEFVEETRNEWQTGKFNPEIKNNTNPE